MSADRREVGALFAHTPPRANPGAPWHGLAEHLEGCGLRAAEHLEDSGLQAWGTYAGGLHDLGKACADWQHYLREAHLELNGGLRSPGHAHVGALAAFQDGAYAAAMAIAGHHGGIPNLGALRERMKAPELQERLQEAWARQSSPGQAHPLELPSWARDPHGLDFFVRLLFSALVDGDFLDTQSYCAGAGDGGSAADLAARATFPNLVDFIPVLENHLASFSADRPVYRLRAEVQRSCLEKALLPPGAFSLTVPTGGAKTLAGLRWALHHAHHNNLRRVVIALPFTAIIDQTAEVLRHIFRQLGTTVLVEHHCNTDPLRDTLENRVASENWDAPLILTTQVQLFESLFGNRPSTSRKMHRLQRAVLLLDEVQTLPTRLLAPILNGLQGLVSHSGSSLLLTTATQPALHARRLGGWKRFEGLDPAPQEIVPTELASRLWKGMRRVHVEWPHQWKGPDKGQAESAYWKDLAGHLMEHPRVLAIVHLKRDAQGLFRALQNHDPHALHLSAALCPAHRRHILAEVHERLSHPGAICRLISTQVVEAGVDLDFPVVYRAMAGLESLAQSAGRCNREGRLEGMGQFRIFDPPTQPPGGLRAHRDRAWATLQANPELDLFHPETFTQYFDALYSNEDLDAEGIQAKRQRLNFAEVAEAFRMVPEWSRTIFVPWDASADHLMDQMAFERPSRGILRRLQAFAVGVHPQVFDRLLAQGALRDLTGAGDLFALHQAPGPHYHPHLGFLAEAEGSLPLLA